MTDSSLVFTVPFIVMVSELSKKFFWTSLTIIECTYDQPSNRKRIPDLRRVENKLKCAEIVLESIMPGVDVFNPSFDIHGFLETVQKARLEDSSNPNSPYTALKLAQKGVTSILAMKGGNHEIDEETGLPKGSIRSISQGEKDSILYSPTASPLEPSGREIKIILPPKHVASELIEAVWDNACVLFRFYHRPSFIRDLDLLYETDPDDYTNKQYKILPLVYSVMAVGVLFSMDKCEKLGFKDASEGYKYFVAARKLIDIADARDTYAIQSIVMMIIFLQCSARLSTCYSYIGVALRSALRAGLHRKVQYNFDPIELETRKRLFWTIRKMDIYVNAMLGLPRSTAESDFDQELPDEIDDENITEDAYFPQQKGKLSSTGIANAHTRLITILSHIMKYIYPVKQEDVASSLLYNVTHSKVSKMEAEIRDWLESLPPELRPGVNPPPQYLKANRLLNLALCHVQIVLYRPFIHYCSPKFKGDEKARVSALNCIGVSRRAMYLARELTSQKLLNGAYWFSIYTIFFSVACLVFYVHENPSDPEALDIRRDAELGKNALTSLKDSSMAAQRTYNLLNTLFEQLNRRTAKMPVVPHQPNSSGSTPIDQQSEFGSAASASGIETGVEDEFTQPPPAKRARKSKSNRVESRPKEVVVSPLPTFGVTATAAAESVNGFPGLNNDDMSSDGQLVTPNAVNDSKDGRKTESPHLYVPGIMDQVDAQLFGRFLPPYMLQQQQPSEGGPSSHVNDWETENGNRFVDSLPVNNNWTPEFGNNENALNGNRSANNAGHADGNGNGIGNGAGAGAGVGAGAGNRNDKEAGSEPMFLPLGANDAFDGIDQFGSTLGAAGVGDGKAPNAEDDDRRFSLSSLFNSTQDWESLLARHNELSGMNSFMTQ